MIFWMERLSLRAQRHWNLHSGVSSRLLLDLVLGVVNDVATPRNIAAVSPPLVVPPLNLDNGGLWTPRRGRQAGTIRFSETTCNWRARFSLCACEHVHVIGDATLSMRVVSGVPLTASC